MQELIGLRKTLNGTVTSNKMDKTVVVEVVRRVIHPIYKKFIKRRKKYMAHAPENNCSIGDYIMIEESRPYSKRKKWFVKEILKKTAEIQR